MYFNRTLLFSIVLCVASALASSLPLEARTLEERRVGRVACIGNGGVCQATRQCCGTLTCTHKREIANRDTTGELVYVVSDAGGPVPPDDRKLTFC